MIFLFFGTSLALLEAELAPFKIGKKLATFAPLPATGSGSFLTVALLRLSQSSQWLHPRHLPYWSPLEPLPKHASLALLEAELAPFKDREDIGDICSSSCHRERLLSNSRVASLKQIVIIIIKCRQYLPNL